MMTNFSLLVTCIALLGMSAFQNVTAYPGGSGSCEAGPAVLGSGSPHGESESDGAGSLANGGYTTAFVDGIFTLKADTYFKGFMFRLSSSATSAAGAIELLSGFESKSQLMESTGAAIGSPATCAAEVAGACHDGSADKTEVGVKLNLEAGVEYTMMVTVVKEKLEWYYAEQTLQGPGVSMSATSTASPSPDATSAPSASTTQATTTAAPSRDATAASTTPTVSSSPAANTNLAIAGTEDPTLAPTDAPTPASTDVPSPAPTEGLTTAQSPGPQGDEGATDEADSASSSGNENDGATNEANSASTSASSSGSTVVLGATSFLFPLAPVVWLLMQHFLI